MKRMGWIILFIGIVLIAFGVFLLCNTSDKQITEVPINKTISTSNSNKITQPQETQNKQESLTDIEKGKLFEDYIVRLINKNEHMSLINRTSDRIVDGRMDESSKNPDLEAVLKLKKQEYRFAIECKWRSRTNNGELEWSYPNQQKRYLEYSKKEGIEVFVAIGVGGEPDNPREVFIVPLDDFKSHKCNLNELTSYKHNGSYLYYDIKTHQLR